MARRKWHHKKPYEKEYLQAQSNAARRKIEFLLTFEEWLEIWVSSGYLAERGRKSHQYCMGRYGDKGPYAVGNVYITTCLENLAIQKRAKHTEEFKAELAERNRNRIWTKKSRAKVGTAKKNQNHTEEAKAAISKAQVERWADPIKRAKIIAGRRRARFLRTGFY
jgi:hypothetical protein